MNGQRNDDVRKTLHASTVKDKHGFCCGEVNTFANASGFIIIDDVRIVSLFHVNQNLIVTFVHVLVEIEIETFATSTWNVLEAVVTIKVKSEERTVWYDMLIGDVDNLAIYF